MLISATVEGSFEKGVKAYDCKFPCGRIISSGRRLKITSVKDVDAMFKKCIELFDEPFTARITSYQTRERLPKAVNILKFVGKDCRLRLMTNTFCSKSSVAFLFKNLISTNVFTVGTSISTVSENVQSTATVQLSASGNLSCKASSREAAIEAIEEFKKEFINQPE